MSRTSAAWAIALAFCTSLAWAQDSTPAPTQSPTPDAALERDIQIARSLTEASRQATVAANVTFTDAQAAAFWPLYREYRLEVAKQNDRFVALVRQFQGEYANLTDADAKKLTSTYLDIYQKRLELKKKYVGKLEKVLPATLVARAMQVDQKLDAMQDFTIARTIPLVPAAGG